MRTNLRKSVAALAAVGLFAVGCGNNDTPGVEPEDVDTDSVVTEETELGTTEEDMTTTEEDMTTTEEDMGATEEDMGTTEEDMGATEEDA
jgi:uncharacterized lipoprotein NlpE involved in copper resistance